ncbi:DedA family protein [Jeotgalibacillus sp. R-1-5s-1]|uniref:DedA family protein n=1 Tax=Jeotgalibacillus sp. R-1-5s-1 TaxID=2555897 RepID=UPI00106B5150|nr:DedA family protein [Jeotgalibacillus sp. R-1-5s-1]TFE00114.1 DedA family protein [Jeotgalibacillus sp. R-1-5s-1]
MENWLTEIMNEYGYFGVFFLIALENIFPPIPSEVILTFGGFMTVDSGLTIPGVVAASTAGSVAGAIALYFLGVQLDVERLEKIIDRWGKVLRVKKEDLHRADAWFDQYGPWTVFFCRFIPLIRSLISIPAGMSNMNIWVFLGFTTAGTLIWNIVLIYLGASVGDSWETIVHRIEVYSNVVYVILAVLFVAAVIYYLIKRRGRA